MEHPSVLEKNNLSIKSRLFESDMKCIPSEGSLTNPVLENILSEGGDDFFQYLKWIGLANVSNLMVLSSLHHYYYDHNDLKGIRTLINMKRLNLVRHLESFLHTLSRILPSGAYFIGCFKDNSESNHGSHTYQPVRLLNGLVSLLDSRSERNITSRSIIKLLEEYSFKVIDITYINGTSYFWAQIKNRT